MKQAEEEGLLKAGEAGSSTFIPLETDLTSQQRAAFRCIARESLISGGGLHLKTVGLLSSQAQSCANDLLSLAYSCHQHGHW